MQECLVLVTQVQLCWFCIKNQIPYDVLPGANAILTAYAMSGFSYNFFFLWILDHKGASRAAKLNDALNDDKLTILYESPHRLLKLLEELKKSSK